MTLEHPCTTCPPGKTGNREDDSVHDWARICDRDEQAADSKEESEDHQAAHLFVFRCGGCGDVEQRENCRHDVLHCGRDRVPHDFDHLINPKLTSACGFRRYAGCSCSAPGHGMLSAENCIDSVEDHINVSTRQLAHTLGEFAPV